MEVRKTTSFSIASLLLLTGLIAAVISHVSVSRELAETKRELTELRNESLLLDAEDDSQFHAVSLPTYGDLQWRWKVQLPIDGEYRIRYALDAIPEQEFKRESRKMDHAFLGSDGKPLAGGTPFVLELSIHKSNDKWQINANNGDRGSGIYIQDPPAWLETYSTVGWGHSLAGKRKTQSGSSDACFQLLRMRKSKMIAGGSEVDMLPADGILVWLERIE
jgi:hypothetical protein